MAVHMRDLPGMPSFPVYGLGHRFTGYRHLAIWQDGSRFYSVTLGHGRAASDSAIYVETVVKTPQIQVDDPRLSVVAHGPTGYGTALWSVLHDLGRAMAGAQRGEWIVRERNRSDWGDHDPCDRPVNLGPGWIAGTAVVGGQPVPSDSRTQNGRAAVLIDLPLVAVAITGPETSIEQFAPLVDVTHSLATYV